MGHGEALGVGYVFVSTQVHMAIHNGYGCHGLDTIVTIH